MPLSWCSGSKNPQGRLRRKRRAVVPNVDFTSSAGCRVRGNPRTGDGGIIAPKIKSCIASVPASLLFTRVATAVYRVELTASPAWDYDKYMNSFKAVSHSTFILYIEWLSPFLLLAKSNLNLQNLTFGPFAQKHTKMARTPLRHYRQKKTKSCVSSLQSPRLSLNRSREPI